MITEAFGGPTGATDTADVQAPEIVTESIATALRDAGYATFTDLANADVGDLAGLTATLTESRAEAIIQAAPRHVPVYCRSWERDVVLQVVDRLDASCRWNARPDVTDV